MEDGGWRMEDGGWRVDKAVNLYASTYAELNECVWQTQYSEVGQEEGGRVEQHVHLDRDGEAEGEAAEGPAVLHEQVDGGVQQQHRQGVVEQPGGGEVTTAWRDYWSCSVTNLRTNIECIL